MIKIVGQSTNNPLDRFEEQSHEIKEAQEKLSEIVLAKQVHLDLDLDDLDLLMIMPMAMMMMTMTMMMMPMMKVYVCRQRRESTWRDWLLDLEVDILQKITIKIILMFFQH